MYHTARGLERLIVMNYLCDKGQVIGVSLQLYREGGKRVICSGELKEGRRWLERGYMKREEEEKNHTQEYQEETERNLQGKVDKQRKTERKNS